ncbi:unnamed protein product [Ostreobium quekettii]|uniref:Peptidase S1 domain-containing protein n=1 Tax=Ostreobium quekettii TaxID=121088 RepID=A0A8S1IUX7_9CHLO|nr:unnamed protein product [Ostreobium quekettii]
MSMGTNVLPHIFLCMHWSQGQNKTFECAMQRWSVLNSAGCVPIGAWMTDLFSTVVAGKMHSERIDGMPINSPTSLSFQGGRLAVLATRFPYINMVEVHGKVCTAVAISKTHILTKASCIGAAAGTNFDPGAWKGGPGSSWTPAQQVHIHPNWTGATYDEHDAAILTLGEPVRGQQVVLADPTFCLTQHLSAHTVWPWGAEGFLVSPQTAGADPRRCSTHGCVDATSGDQSAGTGELPGGILVLMEALSASTAAHGCGHTSHANIELGNPDLDLLVGIYALPDIASDSETAEEITWIPTIRPWIEDVIHSGQPPCLEGGHLDPPSPCSNG